MAGDLLSVAAVESDLSSPPQHLQMGKRARNHCVPYFLLQSMLLGVLSSEQAH